jgi:hypothetical protein
MNVRRLVGQKKIFSVFFNQFFFVSHVVIRVEEYKFGKMSLTWNFFLL